MTIYHTAEDRTPYTYLIGWTQHNKWYYGVRFAKNCHPSDLWVSYFTSSKLVKSFVKQFGKPDIIQIRKVFNSINNARNWEDAVIYRAKLVHNDNFLNKCCSKAFSISVCSHGKGKTWEEIYGEEHAKQRKLDWIQYNKNRNLEPWDKRAKGRIHGNTGNITWNKGIPRTEAEKEKMRGPRAKRSKEAVEKSRISNLGKNWYFNEELQITKKFKDDEVPLGWVKGRKSNRC